MQEPTPATSTMTSPSTLHLGQTSHISVDSFKIILEMFSEALIQIDKASAWRPGDAQLVNGKNIILEFYGYRDDHLPSVGVEMFNDRLIGNLRNDELGQLIHSRYQPEPLIRYADEVINWGLVAGLVSVPATITLH